MILEPIPTPEDVMIARDARTVIDRALAKLAPRYERVVRLHYGIGCEPMTLKQIGKAMGFTGGNAHCMEQKAFLRLKHYRHGPIWQLDGVYSERRSGWKRRGAMRNLYVPQWKIAEQEAEAIAAAKAERERDRAARRVASALREAQEQAEHEAAVAAQLERERQWAADAPKRAAEAARNEREWRAMAALAKEQWHNDETLRLWAYAESQRAAAALRKPYKPPAVPVYSPTYNAAFRRPVYAQVKHG